MIFGLFILIFLTFQQYVTEASSCGTAMLNNDIYVPKTYPPSIPLLPYYGYSPATLQQCYVGCTQDNAWRIPYNDFYQCTGFRWRPGYQVCEYFALAKETYSDFQANITTEDMKIFINRKHEDSARNYKFLSIGDSNHTLMGVYGPGKNFALQPDFRYFRDPILNLSASPTNYGVIDYEGSTFNWFSRMVVFCGGKQSAQGSSNSASCWFSNMDGYTIPSWHGPLNMRQGRMYPIVVSIKNKVYISSGMVSDPTIDVIEVIDFDTQTIDIMKKLDGSEMKFEEFTNKKYSCGVPFENLNLFVVTGGNLTWTVAMVDLTNNITIKLPDMTTDRRSHGCSRVVRNGRDYLVVMGGWSAYANSPLLTIELYDMTLRPSSWESLSGISLPTVLGQVRGTLVMKLDDNLCDAMIISNTTGKMHQCSGNYQWTDYDISLYIPKGLKKMAIIDASLF